MTRSRAAALVLALVAAASGLGWLALRTPPRPAGPGRIEAGAPLARGAWGADRATRGEVVARDDGDAGGAGAPPVGSAASSPASPDDPAAALREALNMADAQARGPEVLEARRLLAAALRVRPGLAIVLAEELASLESRELAFQVGRLLAARLDIPEVRAALLDATARGTDAAREAALSTFWGAPPDAAIAEAQTAAFVEGDARGPVRAAAAYGLAEQVTAVDPGSLATLRREARVLALDRAADRALRIEALALVAPDERGQVLSDLVTPGAREEPEVVLAAARLLVRDGGSLDPVRPALERLARDPATAAEVRRFLVAFLEGA